MTCQIFPPSLPSSPSSFEAARARCNLSGVRSLLHIAWVRRIPRSPCGVASTAWHGDAHISRCQKAWHVCFHTVEQFRHKVSGGAGPRDPLQQPLHVKRVVWQPTRFAALHAASREEVGVFSSIDRRPTAQNCVCRAGCADHASGHTKGIVIDAGTYASPSMWFPLLADEQSVVFDPGLSALS